MSVHGSETRSRFRSLALVALLVAAVGLPNQAATAEPSYAGRWYGTTRQDVRIILIVNDDNELTWVMVQYHVLGSNLCDLAESWWAKSRPPTSIEDGEFTARWNWLTVEGTFASRNRVSGTMKVAPTTWADCVGRVSTRWTADRSRPSSEYQGSWTGSGEADQSLVFKVAWDGLASFEDAIIINGSDCMVGIFTVKTTFGPSAPIWYEPSTGNHHFTFEREIEYSSGDWVRFSVFGTFFGDPGLEGIAAGHTQGSGSVDDCSGTIDMDWEATQG